MKPSHHDETFFDGLRALLRQPMTPAETSHFRCQLAAKMAEDDRRRQPEPQLELGAAA